MSIEEIAKDAKDRLIVGVDGEGQDTPDGRHIYTYLAAVDEKGRLIADAYDGDGLSHRACCEMLLSLPAEALKFGFMFSYDVTKIVEEMPLGDRFYLMRPKFREVKHCKACKHRYSRYTKDCPECASEEYSKRMEPLTWGLRKYDYFNGSITITERYGRDGRAPRSTKIWDCFRFFGCAFVEAIKDWGVASPEQIDRIKGMKDKRGAFDVEDPEDVRAYCKEECHLLAIMMRKVLDAHESAGIPLKRYEGAGSTATALLKKHEIASYKGARLRDMEPRLAHAIASSFFGGRFEDSVVGIVHEPVHSFDISSAYPFALSGLPCLRCGTWGFTDRASPELLAKADLAVARFHVKPVPENKRREIAWGPLPFRDEKGSITYGTNFYGWAWAPELLAALAGWPDLVTLTGECWVYQRACEHPTFGFLPTTYRERIKWGKEGAGKALKLGMNAGYGKTAQTQGDDPPFQSWIWAGMTTGVTRGMLDYAIASAEDPWSVLTVATDGICATELLPIWHRRSDNCRCSDPETMGPSPRDTGTLDLPKPLGGWEHKEIAEGMFIAKPGLYWRLKPTISDLRARGIGRREALSSREQIENGFLAWDRLDPDYGVRISSRRFYGAKHSVQGRSRCKPCEKSWAGVPEMSCPSCRKTGSVFSATLVKDEQGRPAYGLWGARTIKIGFDPFPKREREGLSREGTCSRLHLRDLGGRTSAPYKVYEMDPSTTPEGESARIAKEMLLEQPEWGEGLT
jgi:hypothetical protein